MDASFGKCIWWKPVAEQPLGGGGNEMKESTNLILGWKQTFFWKYWMTYDFNLKANRHVLIFINKSRKHLEKLLENFYAQGNINRDSIKQELR